MPFTPKNLDDRTFQDLFQELKRRIPAYLPEWTDHNDSDPGITLMQLFAWLTETVIFRLNQVPDERMFVSFLNLIGFGPAPARSAEAVIALEMRPGAEPLSLAPYELRLTAPGEGDGEEIEFEIEFEAEAQVSLVGAALGAVLVDDGLSPGRLDVTEANRRGDAPYAPLDEGDAPGRALYLGLDAAPPAGPPMLVAPGEEAEMQIFIRCEEDRAARIHASTSLEARPAPEESGVAWEGRVGATSWAPLQVVHDGTRGLRQSGLVRVVVTSRLRPGHEAGDREAKERFWIRCIATTPGAHGARRIRYLAINAAIVRQWRTHARELLFPGSAGPASPELEALKQRVAELEATLKARPEATGEADAARAPSRPRAARPSTRRRS
jgi:predicted phage baseplate assembly protein